MSIEIPKSEQMFNDLGFHRIRGAKFLTYRKYISPQKELWVIVNGSTVRYEATRHAGFTDTLIDKIRSAIKEYRLEVILKRGVRNDALSE